MMESLSYIRSKRWDRARLKTDALFCLVLATYLTEPGAIPNQNAFLLAQRSKL